MLSRIYFGLCNWDKDVQAFLENHKLLCLVPEGVDARDLMQPICEDLKTLESGAVMHNIHDQKDDTVTASISLLPGFS